MWDLSSLSQAMAVKVGNPNHEATRELPTYFYFYSVEKEKKLHQGMHDLSLKYFLLEYNWFKM